METQRTQEVQESMTVAGRSSRGWSNRLSYPITKTKKKTTSEAAGRKSVSDVETNVDGVAAFLQVKVMAGDMPEFMQIHAFRSAKMAYGGLEKFSTMQIARAIKKEFDDVYGSLWHCIVGTNYGSFVTHTRGCFLYFSVEKKINIMLFRTRDPRLPLLDS